MSLIRCLKPIGLLALAVAVVTPSVALGDDQTPPPNQPNGERPPLRGPRVPPEGKGQGAGKENADKRRENRPPARQAGFLGWVAKVKETVKLTEDQTKKVDGVVAEFEAAQKTWKDKNATKAKELEDKSREERKNGGEVSEATKKAIAELNATKPQLPEYQKKVTDILTQEQRAELEAKEKAARDNAKDAKDKKREDARKRREGGTEGGDHGGGTGGGTGGGNGGTHGR